MSESSFKILSLDGGGIRGLFSASLLAYLEEHTGKRLADHFNLIAGTSTGAIIALGLAAGLTAQELLEFYQQHGPNIFSKRRNRLFCPRYDNSKLIAALQDVFGDKTLNDLGKPVCIPSYELVAGYPRVFKDDHHPELHWGGKQLIWKVAAASSAAPLFFPSIQVEDNDSHIDGGIWANNPTLVGITEAMRYFQQPLEQISVLSIGTGTRTCRLPYAMSRAMGIIGWGWGGRIVSVVMDAQSAAVHNAAQLLLPRDNYLRLNVDLSESIALDNYKASVPLIERGRQEARIHARDIAAKFLTSAQVPNSDVLQHDIGERLQ